jgi:hypothetical protein
MSKEKISKILWMINLFLIGAFCGEVLILIVHDLP